MKDDEVVTDPTDWVGSAAADLQPVESALRCQVCKDFYKTPVITSCAHTFCSLCIRRCLTNDGKCPTCRATDQPLRLRRNWAMEETVTAFIRARPSLLQLSILVQYPTHNEGTKAVKRKLKDVSSDNEPVPETGRRKTRSHSRNATVAKSSSYEVDDSDEFEMSDDSIKKSDGLVECPICQERMKEDKVSPHIDKVHCSPSGTSNKPKIVLGFNTSLQSAAPANKGYKERLAQLSYSVLSESALRKKLASLGIPSTGNKQLMTQRHKEWVDISNANSDSSKPRTKRELLRELETWDKIQASAAHKINSSNNVMSKDFDGEAWAQNNNESFKELIARAKSKPSAPPNKAPQSNPQASPKNTVYDNS